MEVLNIKYKKTITLLLIGIIIVSGLLVYKEETTNKEVPKKAIYVNIILKLGELYG